MSSNYKTEMCKLYTLTGKCSFGNTCAFAHGKSDLKILPKKYDNYLCKKFESGYCPYGTRCMFLHFKGNRLKIFKLITSINL